MGVPRPPLLAEERRALLALARSAAVAAASNLPTPDAVPLPARLAAPQGAFVSLRVGGQLRGCIGIVEARDPLGLTVCHCAAAAATEDPRFPPVNPDELADLAIEISVLEEPRQVREIVEIVVGQDGLIVSSGRRRGLLLPQVAIEHDWNREEFLEQTCRKAGLDPDAWLHGARIEAFRAQVFEDRPGGRP
jgi:AmmeMemoRadiSam system protein A